MSYFLIGRRPYAVATPAAPVPVAGSELLTNGGMELDDASWGNDGTVVTNERSADFALTGTYSRKIVGDANDEGLKQVRAAVSGWHIYMANIRPTATMSQCRLMVYAGGYIQSVYASIAANVWTPLVFSGVWAVLTEVYVSSRLLNQPWYVDDVSLKALTLSSLISAKLYAHADIDISAAVTRTAGTQAGIAGRVDDPANPANFLIAYLDGAGNVKVDKCVAGTYTNVISGAVTYGASKLLRLRCSGTSVSVFYDGTQVGTTQTVSDAGIVNNLYHGLFSTYASNSFASYTASSWVAVTP